MPSNDSPRIAVSGLVTLETSVRIDRFPLDYAPIHYPFHGIHQNLAGVGLNVAAALAHLGNAVSLAAHLGDDAIGREALRFASARGIDTEALQIDPTARSSQTVVLVDATGRRQIHLDLKDLQDRPLAPDAAAAQVQAADLFVACNINFTRPLLRQARATGKPIATDVHALSDFDDDYNREFMACADLLFLSDEHLPCSPAQAVIELRRRYAPRVIVIGMGGAGAWLSEPGRPDLHLGARADRPVVNTVGAGDALFAAFIDQWVRGQTATVALQRAIVFAGWKCGAHGATEGLLDRGQWEALARNPADAAPAHRTNGS